MSSGCPADGDADKGGSPAADVARNDELCLSIQMIEVVWICMQPGAPDGLWHQDGGRQQANKKYTTLLVPYKR
jgi:hypothetical protein